MPLHITNKWLLRFDRQFPHCVDERLLSRFTDLFTFSCYECPKSTHEHIRCRGRSTMIIGLVDLWSLQVEPLSYSISTDNELHVEWPGNITSKWVKRNCNRGEIFLTFHPVQRSKSIWDSHVNGCNFVIHLVVLQVREEESGISFHQRHGERMKLRRNWEDLIIMM